MKVRVAVATVGVLMAAVCWPAAGRAQGDPPESTQPATPWGPSTWAGTHPLGLTAEQMTAIQQIVTEWQAELAPVWRDLQTRNHEIERLMMDPTSKPADVAAEMRGGRG